MEYEMNKNIAILFDSGLSVPKESMGKDMYVVPLYIHFKNEYTVNRRYKRYN